MANAKDVVNRFSSWKPNDDEIDFWIKKNLNVMICGHAGVGKTSIILEGFERNGVSYSSFSAPTLDPFLDFRGVPVVRKDKEGEFIEMVMMKELRDKQPEFIFIDEFNRGNKTIRNAVMELVLNHSINGKKMKNLRAVWTGINPDNIDANYDVEPLDPAQEDRFQVRVYMQKVLHKPYFVKKYGAAAFTAADEWFKSLAKEPKDLLTPRRVDFALDYKLNHGGNLAHILPPCTNVDALSNNLINGSPVENLEKLMQDEKKNAAALKKFFADVNNFAACEKYIPKSRPECIKYLSPESATVLLNTSNKMVKYVMVDHASEFMDLILLLKDSNDPNIKKAAENAIFAQELSKQVTSDDSDDVAED